MHSSYDPMVLFPVNMFHCEFSTKVLSRVLPGRVPVIELGCHILCSRMMYIVEAQSILSPFFVGSCVHFGVLTFFLEKCSEAL